MAGKRGRPSLEDEFERIAKLYLQTAETMKAVNDAKTKAYNAWSVLADEARAKEKEHAALLRALLEMNDRVNAKRAKEISKLPANVIPMEQRGT